MTIKNRYFQLVLFTFLALILSIAAPSWADLRLPALIGDGMVLQRDTELQLWGWADPGEEVTVEFLGRRGRAQSNAEGRWRLTLPALPAGGPHRMTVTGKNTLVLEDIWLGDVWVASGQSNMELPMHRLAPLYRDDIAAADDPALRFFTVPQSYDFDGPREDYAEGEWLAATPETVRDFSGVAYFFARYLRQSTGVPMGIINASLGGSPAQAWISEAALKTFPHHYHKLQQYRDPALIERVEAADTERIANWHRELNRKDPGYRDGEYLWAEGGDDKHWQALCVPGSWTDPEQPEHGSVWLKKTFVVAPEQAGQTGLLVLGTIIDSDTAFINGQPVGSTGYRYPPRRYPVPEGLLRAGENTLVLRVVSARGQGRLVADKTYQLQLAGADIDLDGKWHYRIGASMPRLESQTFVRWQPGGLYNAMLAPMLNYRITGVIWYQGESNVSAAEEYRSLFPALIADWRDAWDQGDFPFLFVQLTNYLEAQPRPADSDWARLREAQLQTLTQSENTAMAVTVDIGEWNDIHPLNKKDVGKRLALAARVLAYGQALDYSGPLYRDMTVENGKAVVSFTHVGEGLSTADGQAPAQVAIAGEDRQFVWAETAIHDGKLLAWSPEVKNPVAVRYAWADNPEGANLINSADLPVSPFRTDNW